MSSDPVRIAGAGLAGLSAAIGLARRGRRVEVYDRAPDSGLGRQGEWDGMENWTGPELEQCFAAWGIAPDFEWRPMTALTAYDASGFAHRVTVPRPYCLLVRRGPQPGGLEHALKAQAMALGVELRYGQARRRDEVDLWAVGCVGVGYFLGAGMTFHTDHPDTVAGIVDTAVAPRAYAYLMVVGGEGTLSTVLTRDFRDARAYLERSLDAFRRLEGLEICEPRFSSGYGGSLAAFLQPPAGGGPLLLGEAAGFQDYLWGFGIRMALLSGHLAARALGEGLDYRALVEAEIHPLVRASLVNRLGYDLAGDRGYARLIRQLAAAEDLHDLTGRWYRGETPLHHLAWPLARRWAARSSG